MGLHWPVQVVSKYRTLIFRVFLVPVSQLRYGLGWDGIYLFRGIKKNVVKFGSDRTRNERNEQRNVYLFLHVDRSNIFVGRTMMTREMSSTLTMMTTMMTTEVSKKMMTASGAC